MNTPVREGETIEGSRTTRNRPYPVLKCSTKSRSTSLYNAPASSRGGCRALQLYIALQRSRALYISTALQRSTLYILYTLPQSTLYILYTLPQLGVRLSPGCSIRAHLWQPIAERLLKAREKSPLRSLAFLSLKVKRQMVRWQLEHLSTG